LDWWAELSINTQREADSAEGKEEICPGDTYREKLAERIVFIVRSILLHIICSQMSLWMPYPAA